jgi:hypothetical protein
MNRPSCRLPLLGALAGAFFASEGSAVGTRRFDLQTADDFKGGDLKGVAVDSTGKVRAGFDLGAVTIADGTAIWSLLPRPDGSVLLGTGNDGKLVEVKNGAAKVVAETRALVVTSLVEAWGGTVVLGTLPDGKVMKWERGKLSDLATIKGVEHVWQVAFDKKSNSVFAATGPEGKLYRINQNGQAQVHFDAEEKHLMSVAVAPDGTVYAGASDKAKLYKVTAPGRASVLHDFGRTEVRAIAIGQKGELFAIANEIKAGSYTPMRRNAKEAAGPVSSPPQTSGKGILVSLSSDGAPDVLLDDKSEHFTALALGDDGKPYVGTGVEGRVYTVDEAHASVLVADVEERMIGALVMAGKARFVGASDPAVLRPVRGVGGPDAVWTSKVMDAALRAQWGRMSWTSTDVLELSTRSGNTTEPDDTWSAWSDPMTAPGVVKSPAARFLQVRARWNRAPDAVLSELRAAFVTDNLRAVLTQIESSGGGKKKSPPPSGGEITGSGGPTTRSPDTKLNLSWQVDNPDKDELRYRLQYRLVGTTTWHEILKPGEVFKQTSYTWETADLPEGSYRLRVTASDELANPPDRVKKHMLESAVVLVDNTPPTIQNLAAAGRRVKGTAQDGVGPIQRIEISVSGSGEWFPFFPTDGVFDEQSEEFDADVASLAPAGAVLLSVRVYDDADNFVVRNVALK